MINIPKEQIRSQTVTASNQKKRNINNTPYAFTEHGVTMLASILRSEKAIQMNIAIVEAFISLKEFALNYKDLADRLNELEGKFTDVAQAINYLLKKDQQDKKYKERRRIGFDTGKPQTG